MKAAVLKNVKNIEIKDVPDPELEDGEVLIEVKNCAICGTDVKMYNYGYSGTKLPLILGHELAGRIIQSNVNDSKYKVGDRVTINPNIPCGLCYYCVRGLQTACDNLCTIGVHRDGGFARFIKIPTQAIKQGCIFHIPENVSYEEAALIDPLSCVINGAELSNLKVGGTVVVIGAGPAGCLNIEVSKAFGVSKTILIQRSPERLKKASFTEADIFINSSKEDPVRKVLEETEGRGADRVIIACASKEAQEQSVKMVKKRGIINLFGGLPKESPFIEFDSNSIHYKEAYITGTHGCSNRHCKIALDMISSGRVKAKEYISYKLNLSKFKEALKLAEEKKGLKIMIEI